MLTYSDTSDKHRCGHALARNKDSDTTNRDSSGGRWSGKHRSGVLGHSLVERKRVPTPRQATPGRKQYQRPSPLTPGLRSAESSSPVIVADDPEVLKGPLFAGVGLMMATDMIMRRHAADGLVQPVLPGWLGRCPELYAVYPRGIVRPPSSAPSSTSSRRD